MNKYLTTTEITIHDPAEAETFADTATYTGGSASASMLKKDDDVKVADPEGSVSFIPFHAVIKAEITRSTATVDDPIDAFCSDGDAPTPPTPEPPPVEELSTTLFADGTLIINEWKTKDREANIAKHGAVTHEYEPGPYNFESQHEQPWNGQIDKVLSVEFGSIYRPVYCQNLFFSLSECESINFKNFDTELTANMENMFNWCGAKTLDLSGFNTANVTNMRGMFANWQGVGSLDLSSFDTASVTDMWGMFENCRGVDTIRVDATKFKTEQVEVSTYMFQGCTSLVGGAGTTYDSTKTDKTYARIDNPPDEPGYFTAK